MSHDDGVLGSNTSFSFPVTSLEELAADFATGRLSPEREDEVIARMRADEAFRRLVVPIADRCVAPERERSSTQRRPKRGQESHSRRSAAAVLEQVLNGMGAPWRRRDRPERLGIDFDVVDDGVLVACSAFIECGPKVTFQVDPALEVEDENGVASRWIRRSGRTQAVEKLVCVGELRELFLRSTVECADMPNELLPTVLSHAITSLLSAWRGTEPRLRRVLGLPDNRWPGIPLDGPDPHFRWRGSFDHPRRMALGPSLRDAVKRACGEEVMESLWAALGELGRQVERRLHLAGADPAQLELCMERSAEGAVLTLEAPGVPPLHFRFDPAAILARRARYEQAMTVHCHARPEDAQRVLEGDFMDVAVIVEDEIIADSLRRSGHVPPDEPVRAVVLTERPLALEERGERTEVMRLHISPDHKCLRSSEVLELVCSDTEAWVATAEPTQWLVPPHGLQFWVFGGKVRAELVVGEGPSGSGHRGQT